MFRDKTQVEPDLMMLKLKIFEGETDISFFYLIPSDQGLNQEFRNIYRINLKLKLVN